MFMCNIIFYLLFKEYDLKNLALYYNKITKLLRYCNI